MRLDGSAGPRAVLRAVRRLGLDANPLRRRSDRIEAGLLLLVIMMFCALAPVLAVKADQWVSASGTREVLAEHARHPVASVPAKPPALPASTWSMSGKILPQALSRGPLPPYRAAGFVRIPGPATQTGALIPVVASGAGDSRSPVTMAQVRTRAAAAAVFTPLALALILALALWGVRRILDRRRLAAWGMAWAVIGPQWSRRP